MKPESCVLTLVPLPALEPINTVAVDHNRIDLVFINLFHRSSSLCAECLLSVAQDKIDLARNGFSSLGMITYV